MGFMEAVKTVFARYVDFQGRSPRSEYWWFYLFTFICNIVINVVSAASPEVGLILIIIFVLATLIPSIAVSIRRLHDLDKSGWWILIALVPIVGAILLIVWFCTKGTDGDNRFGPDPLGNLADRFS